MVATVTDVTAGFEPSNGSVKVFEVSAPLDADTEAVLTHNFGMNPQTQPATMLVPVLAAARLSLWIVAGAFTANLYRVQKATTVGSGDGGTVQLRVWCWNHVPDQLALQAVDKSNRDVADAAKAAADRARLIAVAAATR